MSIQLPTGELRKVENLSASGLYVTGKPPGPLGMEVPFVVKAKVWNSPNLSLNGKVTRIDPRGFGVAVTSLPPTDRLLWEGLILQATSFEIEKLLQPGPPQTKPPPVLQKIAEVSEPGVTRPEVIEVKTQQEFAGLFLREISNNNLVLYSNQKHGVYNVGDQVLIQLKLPFVRQLNPAAQSEFALKGKVHRIARADAIVELAPSCLPVIAALKQMVTSFSRHGLEEDFRRQGKAEHKKKHPGPFRLVLLLALLAACIFVAYKLLA
jgi:hypothetical protein